MSEPIIRLENLSKTFGRGKKAVAAVRGIDLDVAPGQVFGFLGPNGAGKSTTIRILMDLVRPTGGKALLFGQDVQKHPELLRRVGALVEGALLYEHLTGRRNLEVLARTAGHYSKDEINAVLDRVGMSDRADRLVEGYSMGMKQRLGVAAALLNKPELVILDEPTNGLDPAGIHEMRHFIRQLVEEDGLTVFLSSHLLSEVEQVCDRVAIIHGGKIVREGTVQELVASQPHMVVEVSDSERAIEALSETWSTQAIEIPETGSALRVAADRDAAPEIVRRLVAAEINVFGLQKERRSLEDFFLELTTEKSTNDKSTNEGSEAADA